ncbi:MAG: hypothetical protein KY476_16430 [Planctomycetes bacterium]|nr:hypothetical protein [Planctomycetota bacterium]
MAEQIREAPPVEHRPTLTRPAPAVAPPHAIIHPVVDALCCGGLSIVVIGGILAAGLWLRLPLQGPVDFRQIVLLSAAINWPHFMASYRLLYGSPTMVRRYPLASLYVPVLLVCATAVGLSQAVQATASPVVEGLSMLAAVLLAWHYTGQAWGMTASFAWLKGLRFEPAERRRIRLGLYVLLVWHVLWAVMHAGITRELGWHEHVDLAYLTVGLTALLTLPVGLAGFLGLWKRTGIAPPLCAVLPWAAIYLWYVLIFVYPALFIALQLFHALQYIIFPLRVEMNRHAAATGGHGHPVRHALVYYAALVGVGLAVYLLPELLLRRWDLSAVLLALVAASVSIHHYFIDGAVWKLRNPHVRRDLFAHISTG